MGLIDALFCILLPPFASGVRARGCGTMLFVLLLTVLGWLPGMIAAFYLTLNKPKEQAPPTIIIQNFTEPPKTE